MFVSWKVAVTQRVSVQIRPDSLVNRNEQRACFTMCGPLCCLSSCHWSEAHNLLLLRRENSALDHVKAQHCGGAVGAHPQRAGRAFPRQQWHSSVLHDYPGNELFTLPPVFRPVYGMTRTPTHSSRLDQSQDVLHSKVVLERQPWGCHGAAAPTVCGQDNQHGRPSNSMYVMQTWHAAAGPQKDSQRRSM